MDNSPRPSLHELVKSDENVSLVRELLARGANPNMVDSHGNTLLHAAAKTTKDNLLIVQELINAGVDIDRTNSFLFTPLQWAVIFQKCEVVDIILRSTNSVNQTNIFGNTALHYAVNNPNLRSARSCRNPMHIEFCDRWIVKKLLDHENINVNRKNMNGVTPLLKAILLKDLETVKLLINKNPKLDISDRYGKTALHIAFSHNPPCPYTVAILLLKRASLFKTDTTGKLDIMINTKSIPVAIICLKIIAFNYDTNTILLLKNKLKKAPELLNFLNRCLVEIDHMKRDIIQKELTVFDFFMKRAPLSGFDIPIFQIKGSVVQNLISGLYPVYFSYILKRISKSSLSCMLDTLIAAKYCDNKYEAMDYRKKYPTKFTKIIWNGLLSKYLSCLDIFSLIVAFSTNIDRCLPKFREHDSYLPDSWDEYPDTHFY